MVGSITTCSHRNAIQTNEQVTRTWIHLFVSWTLLPKSDRDALHDIYNSLTDSVSNPRQMCPMKIFCFIPFESGTSVATDRSRPSWWWRLRPRIHQVRMDDSERVGGPRVRKPGSDGTVITLAVHPRR